MVKVVVNARLAQLMVNAIVKTYLAQLMVKAMVKTHLAQLMVKAISINTAYTSRVIVRYTSLASICIEYQRKF